ncbi:MAG: hypothetical protein QM780_02025 [Hyphomicrobium sp.]|uniref:hypothetical protein n=1 Tax=Hyphomicrobium sp. TaxID=82 RepID=UPI0039E50CC9
MQAKTLLTIAAIAIAVSAAPVAFAAKAKKAKHAGSHKSHHIKGWKSCNGTYKYLKDGKCLDARSKKTKS